MNPPPLSFVLVTSGRQPLIRFSLTSLLGQLEPADEFLVSINSVTAEQINQTRKIIAEVDPGHRIKVTQPPGLLTVYEHYRFGIAAARHDHLVIVHDDDIYHPAMASELRTGFSDPEVTVVAGGLMRVDLYGDVARPAILTSFAKSAVIPGAAWLEDDAGLYPRFCFSAVPMYRPALDLTIFSATSTAADCLAVAQLALAGKVYQSEKIFATWLQLSGRTSKWALIKPGSATPYREFLIYYQKIGNPLLAARAASYERASLQAFVKMLFVVALPHRNPVQIDTCLQKIREISPATAAILSWVRWPVASLLLSPPCRLLVKIKQAISRRRALAAGSDGLDAPARLGMSQEFWDAWVRAALAAS